MHLKTATSAATALTDTSLPLHDFYPKAEDVLLQYLDKLYGHDLDASDHLVLTQKYEKRVFEDMNILNNLRLDKIARVTGAGNEIVDYVDQIVKDGLAYTSSYGSVYFDIVAFKRASAGHPYARQLIADGEGALSKARRRNQVGLDCGLVD